MSSDVTRDFSALQDGIYGAVMSAVKAVGALAAADIDFQRSSDPEFASAADATGARILELANLLLRSAATGSDIDPPVLAEEDDVETKWGDVVEVADFLLERAVCACFAVGVMAVLTGCRIRVWTSTRVR